MFDDNKTKKLSDYWLKPQRNVKFFDKLADYEYSDSIIRDLIINFDSSVEALSRIMYDYFDLNVEALQELGLVEEDIEEIDFLSIAKIMMSNYEKSFEKSDIWD